MKSLAALLFVLVAANSGAAERKRELPGPLSALGPVEVERAASVGNRFDAKTWRRVKIYDMQELKRLDPLPLRKIVGVRFEYRNGNVNHWKPNWFQSSIWQHRRGARDEFDYIQILVAKGNVEAFRALPTNPTGEREQVVYGQVLKDTDANFTFLRLIGTKVKSGRGGRITVTW